MDAQSESCEPPPCDPQPPGKIRKALKLLSKRRQGGGVASIFSVRGKCDAGLKSPPSRSNTVEGLTETAASEADAESLELDQDSQRDDGAPGEPGNRDGNLASSSIRQSISSITSAKSLSFLTMLRKTRKGGQRQAQTESLRPGQQRKGLKGLFGNVRWPRRDKEPGDEVAPDPGPPLLASRSNSVEIMKETLTLTPSPAHRSTDGPETEPQLPPQQDDPPSSEGATRLSDSSRPPTSDRLSSLLGDISSILNLDQTEGAGGMIGDVEAEWVKASSRVEEGAGLVEDLAKKDLATVKPPPSSISQPKPGPSPPAERIPVRVASPRPTASPTTKQTLPSASTPSPTTHAKHAASALTPPTGSPTTKPALPSVPTPAPSPVPAAKPIPVPATIPTSPPISPTVSTLIPASPPTPEPSPKPSPTPSPASTPVDIPETPFSLTVKSYQEPAVATDIVPEPTSLPKSKPTPGTKYPPFITSTKPTPAAPAARPKIVTTFGLSTSRNTAPIIKPEPKPCAPQTKSSPPPSQADQAGSQCAKTPTAEHPEFVYNSLPSGFIPTLVTSTRPPPAGPPSYGATKVEKEQQNISSRKGLKETPGGEAYARPPPSYRPSAVKPTTLSKIPVSGGVRSKQPPRDSQPNGSNGHSNPPTPVNEDERQISFSRESSSRDLLSDVSAESGAVSPVLSHSNEDILELSNYPGTGATGLPRESRIPVKHGSTTTYHSLQGKTEATRSKIPVSKVPVRRSGNKPASSQK
ncbi:APC membrane recruitment protein 2 [Trichomycterus rosablanca]|uniref:APC membrane recruitment protein 2 n=1 Tax=Trichomycterus rosablanca TaxID=2290929 RepID=UPI002F3559E2